MAGAAYTMATYVPSPTTSVSAAVRLDAAVLSVPAQTRPNQTKQAKPDRPDQTRPTRPNRTNQTNKVNFSTNQTRPDQPDQTLYQTSQVMGKGGERFTKHVD